MALLVCGCEPEKEYIFPGVEGPEKSSTEIPFEITSWKKYSQGERSRLVILLSDESKNWLGLARGLKTIGVPFVITRDLQQALRHRVVFIYPSVSTLLLEPQAACALKTFVINGGTLIAADIKDDVNKLFGFSNSSFSYLDDVIRLNDNNDLNNNFTEEEEKNLLIKMPTIFKEHLLGPDLSDAFKTRSFQGVTGHVVAYYGNGEAAIIQNQVGNGQAIAFGFDLGLFLSLCYAQSMPVWQGRYINQYIPTADVFLRLIKEIYSKGEPESVTLWTVPDNRSLSVIFTHDVTSRKSMNHMLGYAAYEKEAGVPATYFIVTKYISDFNETYFFDAQSVELLNQVDALGGEIASHTVSHSLQFGIFPLGTGKEKYPSYRPVIMNKKITKNGTVMGELRVSKFLLEDLVDHVHVTSFRSGYLVEPKVLPQTLVSTGYMYNSSTTANSVWSHLPYQATYGGDSLAELNVFMFPLTFDDQHHKMSERIKNDLEIAHKIARYGGLCIILIHPEFEGDKLEYEKHFVQAMKEMSWFCSIKEFGDWWSARNEISLDTDTALSQKKIKLKVPKKIKGLTLEIPGHWQLAQEQPSMISADQVGNRVILGEIEGEYTLIFYSINNVRI